MCPRGDVFITRVDIDVKKHLTIDEQIELLKTRGCIIENEELAKNILLDITIID